MRRVALMLAVPRPLQLERILPVVASLGVSTLVLCQAKKVSWGWKGVRGAVWAVGLYSWEYTMVAALLKPNHCHETPLAWRASKKMRPVRSCHTLRVYCPLSVYFVSRPPEHTNHNNANDVGSHLIRDKDTTFPKRK